MFSSIISLEQLIFHFQKILFGKQPYLLRPLWIIILFSRSVNLNLFEIAIYSWLGSIGDTKEFQVAFRCKITWNDIFVKRSLFCNRHATRSLSNGEYRALCDETKQRLRRRLQWAWHRYILFLLIIIKTIEKIDPDIPVWVWIN